MRNRQLLRSAIISSCIFGANFVASQTYFASACQAQQLKSLLTSLSDESKGTESLLPHSVPSLEFGDVDTVPASNEKQLEKSPQNMDVNEATLEKIRERFKDGRVHIERHVVLDRAGNFVNHGNYEEWNQSGDVVCTGNFEMGERQGPWIRFHQAKESKLFSTQPYSRFKPPFQSSVEFEHGKMNGIWVIVDADRRVVSQIQLSMGTRNGQSTWFYPNGQVMFQADYSQGVLNGAFVEKSTEGKVIREEHYVDGQRSEVVKEQFANKTIKSETHYLTAAQRVLTQDDWESVSLATYSTAGERLKHGPFVVYHDNGQVKMRGTHDRGIAAGLFETWHANGEKEVSGSYENGHQHGKWSWWHANGMRQSMATYDHGKVVDEVLAWNDQGKRVVADQAAETRPSEVKSRNAQRLTPASAPVIR